MIITELDERDADAAIALWGAAGLTRPWNDARADFARAAGGPSSAVFGAVDAGQLIGTAMVGHDGHRGWVYYLAVASEAQREGHGAALMAACEAWLRERGIPKVNLMVRTGNTQPQAFYDALGYDVDAVSVRSKRLT